MKIDLPYLDIRKAGGRTYYYFRKGVDASGRGGTRVALPGHPGMREFQDAYRSALREYAPQLIEARSRRGVAGRGSVAWVIEQYKLKSKQWEEASASTREIYDRRHYWLADNYGSLPIVAFDRDTVKAMRDLPEFAKKPSVADAIVERFATLWDFAEEFLHLDEMREHRGINPARNIKKLKSGEAESAPLWPLDLCKAIEAHHNRHVVTFYFLARYTGQRRSDLVGMRWEHINAATNEMFVAQLKTSVRIWVPMPKRLREYLETWPRRGDYIVTSPKVHGAAWEEQSLTNEFNRVTRELGYSTTDSKGRPRTYSPHGLRHLCGVELAHAGASDRQIAAVLGHSTLKQVEVYVKQAEQRVLARDAQRKRDEMYDRERLDAMIDAAANVTKLRAS
ncbi:MAG: tyrosine-type recombinase/integrase [Xanthobacteraceae bacterium]